MTAASVKPGDVVVLRSGGPNMTVQYRTTDGAWACSWYEYGNSSYPPSMKKDAFQAEALKIVEQEESST